MKYVCFHIKIHVSIEEAWHELESLGCKLAYSSESPDGSKEIFGYVDAHTLFESSSAHTVLKIVPASEEMIDWEAQWLEHGLDYHDGLVHVDLTQFGYEPLLKNNKDSTLLLEAGPGFGDLSHPTTRLMLRLMPEIVPAQYVLDMGSGSGVLALAALLMGAKKACGIDIDGPSNVHASKNARLNELGEKVTFILPDQFQKPVNETSICVLMNMIRSEQIVAWNSVAAIHGESGDCVTSGILKEERAAYLEQVKRWGWELVEEKEEGDWLGFHFRR